MAKKPTYDQLKQKVKKLEKEVQDHKCVEDALKDYIAYQSVLSVLRGVEPEQTEEMLFQIFLSEIVKQYGFCMSWYGQYSSGEIKPILSAGRVDRYLDNLVLQIREPTSPDAQCAMSQAIIKDAPFSYADLERDEGFRRWRDYALELGYRSNLALPLRVDGQVEGGVMVYADTANAFPEDRIERLQLLTLEIDTILSERRRKHRAEEALRKAYEEVEKRVQERTVELSKANMLLKQEITERKQAEEDLKRTHDQLEKANKSLGFAYAQMRDWKDRLISQFQGEEIGFLVDENGQILGFTQRALDSTGLSRVKLLKGNIVDIVDEDSKVELKDNIKKATTGAFRKTTVNMMSEVSGHQVFETKVMRISMGGRMLLVSMRESGKIDNADG